MSIADRKLREREELSSLILKASMKLFVEKGIEQTTIRNIAESIDYSIGTIYLHFKDKNAILYALHSQCFKELGVQFRVLFNVKDPMERLKAMGNVYIQFAKENPDKYDLMFNLKEPMHFLEDIKAKEWDEGTETYKVLLATINECIEAGHFKGHIAEPLSYLIWSCVHGLCSLEIRARTKSVPFKNPDTIVMEGYEEYLKLISR